MKKIFLLLLFLVFSVGNAQQRKQTIWGTITDGTSTISTVTISIDGTDLGTTSDSDGKYEIKAQALDVLEFSHLGMQTVKIIVEDVTRILNIQMWPKFEQLDEVVVTKSKRKTQGDLAIDYAIDKSIINTSFGYISPETTSYRIGVIDGSELNNAAIDILSAIQGRLSGMRIGTYMDPTTNMPSRVLYLSSGGSLRGARHAVFEVDGMLFTDAPTWIDINNVERIGVLAGGQGVWRYGSIGAGGVVFINTKNGGHGVKEKGTGLPYDRAKLRTNIFEDNALGVTSMRKARPTYLRELYGCSSISMAEEIFNENKVTYQNSPYYFIDSYAFFMEKGHYKFAKQIADKAIKKVERNPMLLKAWAYYFELNGKFELVNELYKQIFILRPHYVQSYRDLAKSYRETGNFKKAASMYARYHYLRDEGFITIADSIAMNTLIERESDNLVALDGDKVLDVTNSIERPEKFTKFEGTRLVFEWNDSEAEFDLQFVNPQKHFHNWEHTMATNAERINDEKINGYATQEFIMDGSLPGKWQVNVNYKGNKRLASTYLKATMYYNYGRPAQRMEVKVFRLGLKNVNHKLFELYNSSKISN